MSRHTCTQEQQVFVDASNPTIRKKIKKQDKQEPYESRVVWRHLTESLERGDKEAAAEAKHTVRSMVYAHTQYTCTVSYTYMYMQLHVV